MCNAGEVCTPFIGDFSGREFGVCMPDSGFGQHCSGDAACRNGLTCQPFDDPSDSDEVGVVCQFNVGDAGAMAPCGATPLSDGGSLSGDRGCKSGKCVGDPLSFSPPTPPYFCLGACTADSDCGDAGVCDADFLVSTAYATQGFVRGCRPSCEAESQCARFDAGVTCKVRAIPSSFSPQFSTTCSPSSGALPPGASCSFNGQCRSNLCLLDDARGVRRAGVCSAPCVDGASCTLDGGVLPMVCQPSAVLLTRGPDAVAGTTDDRFISRKLCSGATCTTNADCLPGGVCAPTLSATNPTGAAALRCQAPTAGTLRGGLPCTLDTECVSGVCGLLQAPSTGVGRACFEACTSATSCASTMSCRAAALNVSTVSGMVAFDTCAP
jgi:hypothetical protein